MAGTIASGLSEPSACVVSDWENSANRICSWLGSSNGSRAMLLIYYWTGKEDQKETH